MRARFAIYGSLFIVSAVPRFQRPGVGAAESGAARGPCVPTEPMPVVGLGAKDTSRMPVLRPRMVPDMPTLRLVPCYLRDTLAALDKR